MRSNARRAATAGVQAAILLCSVPLHGEELPDAKDLPARAVPPDPLRFLDGREVKSEAEWVQERRPELKALFLHYMYGWIPPRPEGEEFKVEAVHRDSLGGKATLKLVTIRCGPAGAPRIDLMVMVPNGRSAPAPAFLALNFCGNHALVSDPRVPLSRGWLYASCRGSVEGRASEEGRGSQALDWAVESTIGRGYALASFASSDVDADRAEVAGDLPSWLARNRGTGTIIGPSARGRAAEGAAAAAPPPRDRGSLALWAWGFHRAVDYLVTDPDIDSRRIAVVGHSRNGKTALLAAAFDERIALAIPHQAGCGGTAPSRGKIGESVKQINEGFPHWFNAEFKKFNEAPERLPFDQNCLIALCAPRPVLLSNAIEDTWANPEGQFDMLRAADAVFRLLRAGGLEDSTRPEPGKLSGGALGYYIRPGKHSMTAEDWKVFLDYADRHLASTRLPRRPAEKDVEEVIERTPVASELEPVEKAAPSNPFEQGVASADFQEGQKPSVAVTLQPERKTPPPNPFDRGQATIDLPEGAKAVTKAPPAKPPPARFCTQCGERVKPAAKFCTGCGTRVLN